MAKLSVIVPVYNTYPYLRECLDSIINQTYKNLEIIIVNDASPYEEDDIICKEYAGRDNRIKYIKHIENKGAGGAKQTGINYATGEYITFVDSDDYLLNINCYKELMDTFKKEEVSIIVFNLVRLYKNKFKRLMRKTDNDVFNLTLHNLPIHSYSMCNKIYKTKEIQLLDYKQTKQKFYEDNLFWIEYASKYPVVVKYVNLDYYYYRYVDRSITNSNTNKSIKLWLDDICETIYEYNTKDLADEFLTKYITEEIIELLYDNDKNHIQNGFNDLYNFLKNNNTIKNKLMAKTNNLFLYAIFIEDDIIRKKYIEEILLYRKFGYKHIKPFIEIKIFKLIREIKRVINQIKNIFKK